MSSIFIDKIISILTRAGFSVVLVVLCVCGSTAYAGNRFKKELVYGLHNLDQRSTHFCDGRLKGLSDDRGREILPLIYSDIRYCGHGIFLATERELRNKYRFGKKRHFFNLDGVESKFKLPPNTYLVHILSFGMKADRNINLTLDKLPKDTILVFDKKNEQQGLCDLEGNILLQPFSGKILFLKPGYSFLDKGGRDCFILNLKSWKTKRTVLQYNPGTTPKPRIPGKHAALLPFPKNRRLILSDSNYRFDRDFWIEKRATQAAYLEMFDRFLHQYNLIGMTRDQIAIALGEPENAKAPETFKDPSSMIYVIPFDGCVPNFYGLKIYLKDDRAYQWSFIRSGIYFENKAKESSKKSTDVVLKLKGPGDGRRFCILDYSPNGFPSVQPKSFDEVNNSKNIHLDEFFKQTVGLKRISRLSRNNIDFQVSERPAVDERREQSSKSENNTKCSVKEADFEWIRSVYRKGCGANRGYYNNLRIGRNLLEVLRSKLPPDTETKISPPSVEFVIDYLRKQFGESPFCCKVVVQPGGKLESLSIDKSSGNSIYDNRAKAFVKCAGPFRMSKVLGLKSYIIEFPYLHVEELN